MPQDKVTFDENELYSIRCMGIREDEAISNEEELHGRNERI